MKVVYEKSITERIREARYESNKFNKKIEYIEVTEEEAVEMYDCAMGVYKGHYCPRRGKLHAIHNGVMFGIKIKVEGYND
jgi:hypothetical protein